ncbi:hypothetical protein ACF1HJ_38445 [Streptomyces sp. NPDC013978]|uniref:hypothetical protein n=1 Tax=Streptomyces sp. NPDC013978 TaxID=3364869 RepID=UPI003702EB4C
MRIPGFAVGPTAPGAHAGDLIVPQQFTCQEELRPVCRHLCRRAHNPATCVRKCLATLCEQTWER